MAKRRKKKKVAASSSSVRARKKKKVAASSSVRAKDKESHDGRSVCEKCGKKFNTPAGLSQHNNRTHMSKEQQDKRKVHKCTLCHNKFATFTNLLKHQEDKHEFTPCVSQKEDNRRSRDKKYQCAECDDFLATSELESHYLWAHGMDVDGNAFLCRYCKKGFKQPNLVTQHENVHLNLQPYRCTICRQKRFNSREAFRRHKLDCQARLEGKEHQCPHCDASYTARNSMLHHIRNFHGSSTRCTKCSRVLSSKNRLESHMLKCKGRNIKVTTRRPDFLNPYWDQMELLQYRVAGQDQKKTTYRCVRCKAEGNSRAEVANHIVAVHQPELLHCDLCGKNFATIGRVTSHRRVCQKRKCPHCEEIFCSLQYARIHVANAKCLDNPVKSEIWRTRKLVKREHRDIGYEKTESETEQRIGKASLRKKKTKRKTPNLEEWASEILQKVPKEEPIEDFEEHSEILTRSSSKGDKENWNCKKTCTKVVFRAMLCGHQKMTLDKKPAGPKLPSRSRLYHKCTQCSKRVHRSACRTHVYLHLKNDDNRPRYMCRICLYWDVTRGPITKHYLTEHPEENEVYTNEDKGIISFTNDVMCIGKVREY